MTETLRPEVREEYGYAAVCLHGEPRPFISIFSVSMYASKARQQIAQGHQWPGETEAQGWKRAYREGWRIKRVRVALAFAEKVK